MIIKIEIFKLHGYLWRVSSQTAPTEIDLHRKFYNSKIKQGMDPGVWILQMEGTRMRLAEMKSVMMDKHILMHLISKPTLKYEWITTLV